MSASDRRTERRRRLAGHGARGLEAALRLAFFLPFYRFTLIAPAPRDILFSPPDPWPGNAERGGEIGQGTFAFCGETVREPALWAAARGEAGASACWRDTFHGFVWLRDLHMIGSDGARQRARALVKEWTQRHARWRLPAWRGDVTGRRIAAWLGQYDFFCASADDAYRGRVLSSLSGQARHLARVGALGLQGPARLAAAKGLVYAGACLPRRERWLAKGLRLLERELPRQILADGGHVSRNPSVQLEVLRDLIDIRATLVAGRYDVPGELQAAIDRAAPMLRFFRHGDGGLALFNGGHEEERWLVDMVLTRADARGKPLSYAPHTGFQRMLANRALVIADTGAPPAQGRAHAGTLSFEMSVGKERLIVNCGAYAGTSAAWSAAARASAAHSTLVVEDTNSSELTEDGRPGRRPETVEVNRHEADGNIWIECSHDGYVRPFGLVHRRRLYLAAGGDDLRGEDSLVPVRAPASAGIPAWAGARAFRPRRFAVRFHLHPRVKASLVQDGTAALLRLPSGMGWRLRAAGGTMSLEESVYLGADDERMKRGEQIVVRGATLDSPPGTPAAVVKWALRRVGEKG